MLLQRISFVIAFFITIITGCKKHPSSATCEKIKEGMITHHVEDVKSLITRYIDQLSSKNYTLESLINW